MANPEVTDDIRPQALARYDAIIDVRSPAEFAEDHVPGAINLPVLSNEERAVVGTIYVQESRFKARRVGAALVARNVAQHIETALKDKDGAFMPLVYCWRGGQRSGAMATILAQVGWRTSVLAGGYKTYRRWVYGAAWMRQTQSQGGNIFQRLLGGLYIGLSNLMAPGETRLEQVLEPKLAQGGDVASNVRDAYRRAHVFIVKRSGLLSSNSRTLAACLAVLVMHPAWFFIYETTALNAVLLAVLMARALRNRRLAADFAG